MVASPGLGGFLAALEGDFRQISQDARRSDGFSGLFSSHDYPEIKEAAERAVLRVRGIGDQPGALDQIRSAKVGEGEGGEGGMMWVGGCRKLHPRDRTRWRAAVHRGAHSKVC